MDLQNLEDSFFKDKKPSPPIFIITYGPPGSGKTDIVKNLTQRFGIPTNRLVNVLVDDIVEKIPGYMEEMKSTANLDLPGHEIQQELTKVYFKYRRSTGDFMSESVLNRAFVGKYHVVWETTGDNIDWALKTIQLARQQGYMVFLVYPFVSEKQLLKRVAKRAKTSDNPRKPDAGRVKKNIITAQKNFITISKYVDKSFVYDNDGNVDDLDVVIQIDRIYQGWCKSEDPTCKRGVITKSICNEDKLQKLKRHFDETYGDYIEKVCG